MRVVFLTHNYPGRPGDLSGAPLGILARALMRRGILVRVIAPGEEGGETEMDGVPIVQVRVSRSIRELVSGNERFATGLKSPLGWLALRRVRHALKAAAVREIAAGADVLHAHRWVPAGLAAPAGIPLVLTVYGTDASMLRRSRLARSLARPLLQRANTVTAISREIGNWVQTAGGRFVDPRCIQPVAADTRGYPWTRGGAGAVVISRLVPSQRVDLALHTVGVLASSGRKLPLTVVGDGRERASLEQLASSLGISPLVRFVGAQSGAEALAHLERADVLLFTARGDGIALSAIEALSCGVPVVASWDSGEAVNVVPETGPGRLTLPSAEALADSVTDLLDDPDRLPMGRLVGESWRARRAPDHVAELCEGWYRNALAG